MRWRGSCGSTPPSARTSSTSPASSCRCPPATTRARRRPSSPTSSTALAPYPAYLLGPRTDVLAWNAAATAMLGDADARAGRTAEPPVVALHRRRAAHEQGQATARSTLARFRAEHARRIGDPDFAALIEALSEASEQFRAWWPRHEVLDRAARHEDDRASPGSAALVLHHLQSAPTSHPDLRLTSSRPPTKRHAKRSLASSPVHSIVSVSPEQRRLLRRRAARPPRAPSRRLRDQTRRRGPRHRVRKGLTTREAARAAAPGGVVGVDISERMLGAPVS